MKILYIIESFGPGGKERRLSQLIESLINRGGYEIEIVVTAEVFHYKNVIRDDIKIHKIDKGTGLGKHSGFIQFYKICKRFKPDIIHTWGGLITVLAIPSSVLCRVPLIDGQVTAATTKPLWEMLFFYKIPFLFSKYVVSNTFAAKKVYGIPDRKFVCIYNGFNHNRIIKLKPPGEIRKRYGIKTKYLVGMIASFLPAKDHKTVIKAAINLLKIRKDVSFIFSGKGDSSYIQETIPSEIQTFFHFTGPVSEVENIMNACDIGVLSSFNEGLPNVVLEFMALGKPVIATDVGGVPEIINNGFDGFIFSPGDYTFLSSKISELIENDELRIKISKNAEKKILTTFNIDQMTKQYISLYNKALKE